jgi:hypothetical protein
MDVPEELVEDLARGNCVLFVGAGLSIGAGVPDWSGLMHKMMTWATEHGIDLRGIKRELKGLIRNRDHLIVAQELRDQMGEIHFRQFMQEVFRKDDLQPTDTHRLLPGTGFAAVVTTNYDKLLEATYASDEGVPPESYTQEQHAVLSRLNKEGRFYILKLHGDIDSMNSIVLGRSNYRGVMFGNPAYRAFLGALFLARTVLFIGASFTDLDLLIFLDELSSAFAGSGGFHYALVNAKEIGRIQRKWMKADYGIQPIPYRPSDGHPEVHEFLEELRDAVLGTGA